MRGRSASLNPREMVNSIEVPLFAYQLYIVLGGIPCKGAAHDENGATAALALYPDLAVCCRNSAQPFSAAFRALVFPQASGTRSQTPEHPAQTAY